MNAKRQQFVDAYTTPNAEAFGNATKAAEVAGYSKRTAYSQGCRLLKDAEVQKAIAERQEAAATASGLTRQKAIDLALEMAAAWKDGEGKPLQEAVVSGGEVLQNVTRQARPDRANVQALELATKIAGVKPAELLDVNVKGAFVIGEETAEQARERIARELAGVSAREKETPDPRKAHPKRS